MDLSRAMLVYQRVSSSSVSYGFLVWKSCHGEIEPGHRGGDSGEMSLRAGGASQGDQTLPFGMSPGTVVY